MLSRDHFVDRVFTAAGRQFPDRTQGQLRLPKSIASMARLSFHLAADLVERAQDWV